MPSRSIIVGLGAEIARFRKDFGEARKEVRKFASTTESVFKGLGVAIGGYLSFRAISAGIRQAHVAITDVTAAAAEEELAQKKLATALGFTSQKLLDQASALQKTTAYADDAVVGAMALIAAFTKSEEATKKATAATLDLASGAGMDLNAAASLVSKTLGSTTNALKRYGIDVEGAAGSTQRLESLVVNISRVFGGQAAAEAETYSGKVKQLANTWGDMKEELGRVVTENKSMVMMNRLLKEAVEDATKWIVENKKELKELVKGAVLFAVESLSALVWTLDKVAAGWRHFKEGASIAAASETGLYAETSAAAEAHTEKIRIENEAAAASWDALRKRIESIRERLESTPVGDVAAPRMKKRGPLSLAPAPDDTARLKDFYQFALDEAMEYDKAVIEGHAAMSKYELDQIRERLKNEADLKKSFSEFELQDAMEYDKAIIEGHAAMKEFQLDQIREGIAKEKKMYDDLKSWVIHGFDEMADAVADFVTTGKLDFKAFVTSAIADLTRMYTKMTMLKTITAVGTHFGWDMSAFKGKAAGGPVSAMTPYWVGERGRELFVPSVPGTVVPVASSPPASPASQHFTVAIKNESGVPLKTKSASFDPKGYILDVVIDGMNRNVNGIRTMFGGA
jgi:hypothetical protein